MRVVNCDFLLCRDASGTRSSAQPKWLSNEPWIWIMWHLLKNRTWIELSIFEWTTLSCNERSRPLQVGRSSMFAVNDTEFPAINREKLRFSTPKYRPIHTIAKNRNGFFVTLTLKVASSVINCSQEANKSELLFTKSRMGRMGKWIFISHSRLDIHQIHNFRMWAAAFMSEENMMKMYYFSLSLRAVSACLSGFHYSFCPTSFTPFLSAELSVWSSFESVNRLQSMLNILILMNSIMLSECFARPQHSSTYNL